MAIEHEIPGYLEVLAEVNAARDLAFVSDLPGTLCGVPVLPLDLYRLILLTRAGNPFVCGGRAGIEDVRMLLWLQSPGFSVDANARQVFVETLGDIEPNAACADIRTWIDDTFLDTPTGRKRPVGTDEPVIDEPIASFVASWVDLLASEYGWTDDYIVGTAARRGVPLRRIYQYNRMIVRRHQPDHPFSCARLVRMMGDWFRADLAAAKEERS